MRKLKKLTRMSDKEIQDWLRRISVETGIEALPIALSGADDEIRECVFRNMSAPAKTAIQKSIQEQSRKKIAESEIENKINIIESLI